MNSTDNQCLTIDKFNTMKNNTSFFQYTILIVLITLGFLLYIQLSPGMGQIWIRNGNFMPMGAFNLMIYPFKNIRIWMPKVWDINYPMWIFLGILINIFKLFYNYLILFNII